MTPAEAIDAAGPPPSRSPEEEQRELEKLAGDSPELLEEALRELGKRVFVPHEGGQLPVMQSSARFRVLAAGRRWGKTKLAAHEAIKAAQEPNQVVWWVANTYKNVARGYKEVLRQLPPSMLKKVAPVYTSTTLYLQFKNGSVIEFYSGGSPDALAGEGVNFVVVDEGGLIPDNVWSQLIRPTLSDTLGRALIISTPRARNWFWKAWMLGQAGEQSYESWRFPTSSSPYITEEEIASVKVELPELLFRQEYMAEFLAAGASVFGRGVEREGVVVPGLVRPRGHLFMGIDLAKQSDFTVIDVVRAADRMPVHFERFNELSWPVQRGRIHSAADTLRESPGVKSLTIMVDSTGVGDVVVDDLEDEGLDVIPRDFNGGRKEQMVNLLAADLEQGRAHLTEEQRDEFESYAMTITPAGNYKYEASTGHDDKVAAKMLQHWGVVHEGPIGIVTMDLRVGGANVADDPFRDGGGLAEETVLEQIGADSPQDIMRRASAWH